ncbi:ankyrin repeat-containing domain protein [Pyronema domesticum]|nr:ankyrin repeat-containing domain protein [Pyronema domesticum]
MIVRFLIKKGIDVNAEGAFGNALYNAAENGQESMARLLIEKGADVSAGGGEYGNALHAAILEKHKALVQVLLENGTDINSKGRLQIKGDKSVDASVLESAVMNWDKSIAQILINYGANVNAAFGRYDNALQTLSRQTSQSAGHLILLYSLLKRCQFQHTGGRLWQRSSNGSSFQQPQHGSIPH